MSISADLCQQVRQRADCACEFCGVREDDAGATLTIDHFQPRSKGGSDAFDNLVYTTVPVVASISKIIGRPMPHPYGSGTRAMKILLNILLKRRTGN
jgi:HNH endonuclease